MPHLSIEYSPNCEAHVNIANFCDELRKAAISTGIFPIGGTRVRAFKASFTAIGDGKTSYGFLDCVVKIGAGRDFETKKQASEALYHALEELAKPLFDAMPFGLSMNMIEMTEGLSFKTNTIHKAISNVTG